MRESWSQPALEGLLDRFDAPVAHAFAYGSAVFKQGETNRRDASDPQIDVILAVDDAVTWHGQNLAKNAADYSCVRHIGPAGIEWLLRSLGSTVFFNTLVPWQQRRLKYGVIEKRALVQDLLDWNALYISGRLQKPVLTLLSDSAVLEAQQDNLQAAVNTARMLLPSSFDEKELYIEICGLSYEGDMRMGIAEDPHKIQRLVEGSFPQLRSLYATPLQQLEREQRVSRTAHGLLTQRTDLQDRRQTVASLPLSLLQALARVLGLPHLPSRARSSPSLEAPPAPEEVAFRQQVAQAAVPGPAVPFGAGQENALRPLLRRSLASIVRRSSQRQAALGLISAGLSKSLAYTSRKMQKAWRS